MDVSTSTDIDNNLQTVLDDISGLKDDIWCRLISLNPKFKHIEIFEGECLFGRNKECQVKYEDKKISSKHCRIYKEKQEENEIDSRYFIEDLSSNGTYLNQRKIGRGNTTSLVNGNEISLSASVDPFDESRIVYKFQDVAKLRREEKERIERLLKEEQDGQTQLIEDTPTLLTPLKRQETLIVDTPNQLTPFKSNITVNLSQQQQKTPSILPIKKNSSLSSDNSNTSITTSPSKTIPDSLKRKLSSGLGSIISGDGTTTTTTTTGTGKTKDDDDSGGVTKKVKLDDEVFNNSMQENLLCGICQGILYKCLTLIPCMHNYCMYCYGQWREQSTNCPSCRQQVNFAQKNHSINNVIDVLLQKHPDWKREQEEMDDMDKNCKITDEMLSKATLNKSKKNYGYDDDDEDYSDEDDYSDEYDDEYANKCDYCTTASLGQPGFKCPSVNARHHSCSSCSRNFPQQSPELPNANCKLCKRYFCAAYGPCRGDHYNRFSPLNQHTHIILPSNSFNGNQYEQKVTQDYLTKHQKTVNSLWIDYLEKLANNPTNLLTPQDWVCFNCTRNLFTPFLTEQRIATPKSELPDYAQKRDECYYGSNCRTQFNKFDHAKKYNHVCSQTKFS